VFYPANNFAVPLISGHYKIVKVSRLDARDFNRGRSMDNLGYEFNYVDKFYYQGYLSEDQIGEYYFIEWKCSKIPRGGEKIQLQFEYRTVNDSTLKKKNIDVFVDRGGFFQTPLERKGEIFLKEGRVESWKVTILKEGKILDYRTSALWTEI
jgi:hypothetical protein